MTVLEMREERGSLVEQCRALLDKAEEEKRDLSAEQREQYDRIWKKVGDLKDKIEAEERRESLAAAETELRETTGRQVPLQRADGPDVANRQEEQVETRTIELRPALTGESRSVEVHQDAATRDFQDLFRRYLVGGPHALVGAETRALQMDKDVGGGYLVAPQVFQAELIQAVDNLTFMRGLSNVLPPLVRAESLGAPSLDTDPADPTWTNELGTGAADTSMAFGKRELFPHPLAQRLKVSKKLLRTAAVSADAIVRERLAYKIAVVEENAYLNGSGAMQPLGVFTASDHGISTSRDVSTDNTTTAIRFNGLKECEYTLKAPYRPRAAWIFHRDGVKMISKLKDGEGRYIWERSVQVGQPDRILNMPVHESEYAPSTFTTGLYVGILGDFSRYWIVDALTLTIQVLTELYAESNENGYISRSETDGMPVLEEAFARVKLA